VSVLTSPDFPARARAFLEASGPNGALHLRASDIAARQLHEIACALAPLVNDTGGWLIVNDRVDVALASRATGVHLRANSLTVTDVRMLLQRQRETTGNLLPSVSRPGDEQSKYLRVGVSVHSVTEALDAVRDRSDWIVAGSVFPSRSHPGQVARGVAWLHDLANRVRDVPIIAIGGVTPHNSAELIRAGAHGIAAVGGIWGAEEIRSAVAAYLMAIRGNTGHAGR
jgi:thiamine monophosphate synthase